MSLSNKLGLGSVQFGIPYGISNSEGQTSPLEVTEVLNHAYNSKIKIIDTASGYGNAEKVLGENDLSSFKVVSKYIPEKHETIKVQLERSLMSLKIESLYGYLCHRPLSLIDYPSQWEELKLLKFENKVEKIGFSLNKPNELEALIDKGMIPDLIQVPYNYFDNRFKDVLIDLKAIGCEIHSRSTFLQGLFFTDTQKLSPFFDETKESIELLQLKYRDNLSSVLLRYVLSMEFIDIVIMGVENRKQLIYNLENIEKSEILSSKEFSFKEEILMPSNWPN